MVVNKAATYTENDGEQVKNSYTDNGGEQGNNYTENGGEQGRNYIFHIQKMAVNKAGTIYYIYRKWQ